MNLKKEKCEFLRGMKGWDCAKKYDRDAQRQWALDNTVMAADNTRRGAPVYISGITSPDKHEVRDDWKLTLCNAGLQYDRKISEKLHIKRIGGIADFISRSQRKLLQDKKMRFGVSQKALNLYLKYLWCLNITSVEPPHCPLDGIVLRKFAGIRSASWTKSDDADEYACWIKICRQKAGKMSLSEWELVSYNRR